MNPQDFSNAFSLRGELAVITGGGTGIGQAIAQAMHAQGAELAFAHIERMTDRVVPLAKQLGSDITFVMDVASDEEIAKGFAHLKSRWDGFDILVHAVAFAPPLVGNSDYSSSSSFGSSGGGSTKPLAAPSTASVSGPAAAMGTSV